MLLACPANCEERNPLFDFKVIICDGDELSVHHFPARKKPGNSAVVLTNLTYI